MSDSERLQKGNQPPSTPQRPPTPSEPLPRTGPQPPKTPRKPPKK